MRNKVQNICFVFFSIAFISASCNLQSQQSIKISNEHEKNMIQIKVLNSKKENIPVENIIVDGIGLNKNEMGNFDVEKSDSGVYFIEINAEGYSNYQEKINPTGNWITCYLRKSNEYYYYFEGQRISYVPHRNMLFVVIQDSIMNGQRNINDIIRENYREIMKKFNLQFFPFPKYTQGEIPSNFDTLYSGIGNTFVFMKNDSSEFEIKECIELEEIRKNPITKVAGPILTINDFLFPAYTYNNYLKVELDYEKWRTMDNPESFLKKSLDSINIYPKKINSTFQNFYELIFDESCNESVIDYADKISELSDVIARVSSNLNYYQVKD